METVAGTAAFCSGVACLDRTRRRFPIPTVPALVQKDLRGFLKYFFFDTRLHPSYLACWMMILFYSQREGYAYFGKTRVRSLLGLSKRRTDEILRWLIASEYVEYSFDEEALRYRYYLLNPHDGQRIPHQVIQEIAKAIGFLSLYVMPHDTAEKPLPVHLRAFLARVGVLAWLAGDHRASIAEIVRTGIYRERVCRTNLRALLEAGAVKRRMVMGEAVYTVQIPPKGAVDRSDPAEKASKGALDRSYKYNTTKDKYTKTTTDIYSLKSNNEFSKTAYPSNNFPNNEKNETDKQTAFFEKAEKEITAKTDNNPTSPPGSASPPLLPSHFDANEVCREFWLKVSALSKSHDEDRRGGHKVFMRIEKHPSTDEQGKLIGTLDVLYLRRNRDTWCAVDPAKGTQRLRIDFGKMDWLRGRMKGLGGSERDLLWGILVCLHDLRNKFASGLKLDDPENYISKVISNDLTHNQLNMYLDKFTASSNSRVLNIWQHFRGLVAAQKYRPLPAVPPENTARALLELLLQYKESGVSQLHEYAVKHWKTICAKYRGGILSDIINADIIYRNAQELLIDAKSEVGKYDSWKIKS